MQLAFRALSLALLALLCSITHAEVYKYKDADGNWHFSDKKPVTRDTSVQTLNFQQQSKKPVKPVVQLERGDNITKFVATNPYYAPVHFFLEFHDAKINVVIAENSKEVILSSEEYVNNSDFQFYYVIGSPNSQHNQTNYLPPFKDFKPMRVTQSFKGRFSHHSQPNLYAIDLGMAVGTKITAARGGTIIYTRDSYSTAGVSSPFFLDKANVVAILHDDGSYAVYAHLLLGSVKVKPGEKVSAGQVIGLSGNTGYSTGPHLHFVVRKNNNGKSKSQPFKLLQKGKSIIPSPGMWLLPAE